MIILFPKNFQKKVEGMFGQYQFQVGVLKDGPHYNAQRGRRGLGGSDVLSVYAGGPVRKRSRSEYQKTISEVSKANRERLGFNYLKAPFQDQGSELMRFTRSFFDLVFGRTKEKRAVNLLQAVVRNPILRGEYGPQGRITTIIKGFERPMIDTAQLFKAIKATVYKVKKRV